jgi:ABC-type bacteriocin/lantibiotic exporter with double-glycine peptidase domain
MMPVGRALVWADAWGLVWRERRVVLVALACAVLGPVAAMSVPFAAKLVIDEVVGRGRHDLILPIVLGAGVAILIQALTAFGSAQAGALAGQRVVARLRQRLQRHILRLPVGLFDATPTGTLVSRVMTDTEHVHNLLGAGMLQLVSGGLTAVLALGVLCYLNWQLTAVVGIALVVVTIGLTRGFDWMHPAFRDVSELQAALAGRLTETFGGILVVKTYAAERREAHRFARGTHRLLRTVLRANAGASALIAAIALATSGVGLVLLVLGGQAVAAGAMTLGDLAMFVFLVGLLSTPLIQVAAIGSELGRALAALTRIREVLALPTEEARDRGKRPVPAVGGAVVFDNVSYAYVPGQPVLTDVSFEAPAGSITALIGPNGAGKSTLLGLLLGFADPTSGRILIDGQPLAGHGGAMCGGSRA